MASRRALRIRGSARGAAAESRAPGINWANVLASLADAVVVIDGALRVSFLNHAGESLLGVSTRQARGRPLDRLLPTDGWLIAMVRETLALGHVHRRAEGSLTVAAESPVPLTATVSPLFDAAGRIDGATVLLHDLRYRRGLEDVGHHADRAASLEMLSAGLAHEIKNPLGAIKGAAQLLAREPTLSGDCIVQHLQVIVREVDRLSRLLDELGDLSQPTPLRTGPVNIHRVLHAVLDLARQRPEWRSVSVLLQFDPSLPEVQGDEGKLVQVFLNLVINAVQAMGGAGTLIVSTRMVTDYHVRGARGLRGRFLSVDIEDTGSGLGAIDPAHLFAPFFTTKPGGNGLGLAVCQQIVSQHDGRLWLRNRRRNPGTVAHVMLPLAERGDGR